MYFACMPLNIATLPQSLIINELQLMNLNISTLMKVDGSHQKFGAENDSYKNLKLVKNSECHWADFPN